LFLDEPTTGFDPVARRDFHDLVGSLDTTILLTTHDLAEASRLAGRILVLDRGRIVGDGTPAQLADRMAVPDEVRWSVHDHHYARRTDRPAALVHDLYREHGESLRDLE